MNAFNKLIGKFIKNKSMDLPEENPEASPTRHSLDSSELGSRPTSSDSTIAALLKQEAKHVPVWKPGEEILGLYKVDQVFSGGMGYVYIALHKRWNRKVAIKSPNQMMLSDKNLFGRILREARSWTEMGLHPNIAYCYFVRNIHGVPHIVVEYVDGGDLKEWIQKGKCKDIRTGLNLAVQFCHGMAFAHSKGMVHRDIKPANVLMTRQGLLKITDFGLVRLKHAPRETAPRMIDHAPCTDDSLTHIGSFMGTPGYLSPEQAENAHGVDGRTDIFSFGVCLYEMFCGKKPYKITFGPYQDPPEPENGHGDGTFPKALAQIIKKCIRWDPDDRYPNFSEIHQHLCFVYEKLFNEPSPYSKLELVNLEADGLNNQGVSYLELEQYEKAGIRFESAVAKDRFHPQANWNLGAFSRLNQTLGSPEWRDPSVAMLVNILREKYDAVDDIKRIVQTSVNNRNFMDGVTTVLNGHKDRVTAVAFSNDGQLMASASRDKTIKIWVVKTGMAVKTLRGHSDTVNTVMFSPDEKMLASAGQDRMINIWDVFTGKIVRSLWGHAGPVSCFAYSPNGRFLATGSWDKTIRVWEVENGQCVRTLDDIHEVVESLEFSPDGNILAAGTSNKLAGKETTIRFWYTAREWQTRQLKGYARSADSIVFSPDGKLLALKIEENVVHLWNVTMGQVIKALRGHTGPITMIAFSASGRILVTGSRDKTMRIWDVESGHLIKTADGFENHVTVVAASPNSDLIVSSADENMIRLWDNILEPQLASLHDYESLKNRARKKKNRLSKLDQWVSQEKYTEAYRWVIESWSKEGFSPNSDIYPYYNRLRQIGKSAKIKYVMPFKQFVGSGCAVTPDSRSIAGILPEKGLNIWDVETGGLEKTLTGAADFSCLDFSPDGQLLIAGANGGELYLFVVKTQMLVKALAGHHGEICDIAFSPDGAIFASGDMNGTVNMWKVTGASPLSSFEGPSEGIRRLSFSPDGRQLIYESNDRTYGFWDIRSEKRIRSIEGQSVSFSPDGALIASSNSNGAIRIEKESGQVLKIMEGHRGVVYSTAFSPDGKHLISGGEDQSVKIWDVKTGEMIKSLEESRSKIDRVRFSPNGHFVIAASQNSMIKLWTIIPELVF